MSKKTDSWLKYGVIKAVVNNLKKSGRHPKELAYLESVEDVNKAYVIANRYARSYIHLKDDNKKNEFLGVANNLGIKWMQNGNKWLEEDDAVVCLENINEMKKLNVMEMVKESDDEFLTNIEMADKSIGKKIKVEKEEINSPKLINGAEIISMILQNKVLKLNKGFVDKTNLNSEYIGEYNGNDLYFCEDLNCVFGTI